MKITGNTFRSLQETRELNFSNRFDFSSSSGRFVFGFSGDSTGIQFSFESGKVYDSENRLVFNYNDVNSLTLSGDLSTASYRYYINKVLICRNGIKPNFEINNFFYQCSNGLTVEVDDLYIRSIKPTPTISFDNTSFKTSGTLTGTIANPSSVSGFKILSGTIVSPSDDFKLTGNFPINVTGSENFYIQHTNSAAQAYDIEYTLHTSQGDISSEVTAYENRASSLEEDLFLFSSGIFDYAEDSIDKREINYGFYYEAFSGLSKAPVAKNVSFVFAVTGVNYGSGFSGYWTGVSGLSDFDMQPLALDYTNQTLSGSFTMSSNETNFYVRITNTETGSAAPTGTFSFNGLSSSLAGSATGIITGLL